MNNDFDGFFTSVEDAFGFSVPREEAKRLDTAGDLCDYVLTHRFGPKTDCLNRIALHRVRRAMMWAFKLPRAGIQPETDLVLALGPYRYAKWKALQRALGLRLPQLRRPSWVTAAAVLTAVAAACTAPQMLGIGPLQGAFFVRLITLFAAGHALCWATSPLATELQADCRTVGQLAVGVSARNYQELLEEATRPVPAAEVWRTIQNLIAEHWGISPIDVTRETDLFDRLIAA